LIQKLMLLAAALAAVMAAAGVLVVALAFTLYAVMRDLAGFSPEASAATVALIAALIVTIPALVLAIKLGMGRREPTLVERLKTFVAQRPLSAAAAAVAAGVFAVRSPKTLLALLLALLEPRRGRRY
jgi:hypothetical protein